MVFIKGQKAWNKNIPHKKETIKKISLSHKKNNHKPPSRLGIKHSKETKNKISLAGKGNKRALGNILSKETRTKMSLKRKGVKHSKNWSKNISKSLKKLFKDKTKCPNWQGGLSFEPYSVDWTETLKKSIRERDKYICRICNEYSNIVHHIDYNKKNCNPDNLIVLCKRCHMKTNFNRDSWIKYFTKEAGKAPVEAFGVLPFIPQKKEDKNK